MTLKQRILNEINSGKLAFRNRHEIVNLTPFIRGKQARRAAEAALDELEKEELIIRDRRGRYCTLKQAKAFVATVSANARGFAFVTPEDKKRYEGDFFVPPHSLSGAYDGDKVLAMRVTGTDDEAYIIKVIERGRKNVVGIVELCGANARVYSDDVRMPDVFVPHALTMGAKSGDKVLCEITAYPTGRDPSGKILEILGEGGDFDVEELSIIRAHGLYAEFPDEVIKEADEVAKAEINLDGRRDLRDKLIFTIDGADTRDIDDGVSLELVDGKYILGVHIADVSNYVKFHTALDSEAYTRGTSVYFPDTVLPMLPKSLSNGACSLNEGEDRYALSCFMTFDKSGKRLNYEICESVIKSRRKMTYSAVTAIIEGDESACREYSDIVETVRLMRDLCLILERNREAEGCITLDVREAKIYVDGDGNIVIPNYERTISERIIEQFMVSANEAVAEFMQGKKIPCLYRIHESPSPEKAATLVSFLKDLGLNVKLDTDDVAPQDFRKILLAAEDKPYFKVVNKVMLRCMQKARYSEQNPGHFGLASKCYCHFTSPIRRYPDLFVHRALKDAMHGGKNLSVFSSCVQQAGIDCSERERIADEAEREVDDLYKLAYMDDKIGDIYDATVSGVTNFGIFCELDNTIEGIVPLEVLPQDKYEYFPERLLLKGNKHSFRLGDKVKIRVDGCDFGKMRVTFSIAE